MGKSFYDNVDFCNIEMDVKLKPEMVILNEKDFEKINFNLSFSQLNLSYVHAMMWRFLPIGDSFVDVFSSRDTDSHLLQREVDSVNVWLKSNTIGHIMRGKKILSTKILR